MNFFIKILLLAIFVNLIQAEKNIFCYHHKSQDDIFQVDNIDPNLCTHLVYDFYGISPENGKIAMMKPHSSWNRNDENQIIVKLREMKKVNPKLKILISVGYWDDSPKYSNLAKSYDKRKTFIDSAVEYMQKHKIDGMDFSWKWPGKASGDPSEDYQNHLRFVQELKEQFQNHNLLLVALVNALPYFAKLSYHISQIGIHLDFVILHAYNMHHSQTQTGFGSAILLDQTIRSELLRMRNIETIINFWLQHGVPSEKLILGISTYGNAFNLENHRHNKINSPSLGPGQPYQWTVYNKFCLKLLSESWKLEWNTMQLSQYAYKGNYWVEFDSLKSVELKSRLANEYNLGGVMLNAIKYDDYEGNCEYGDSFPLLKTINSVLKENVGFPEFEYVMEVDVYKKNIVYNNYTKTVYHSEQSTFLDD